MLALRASGPFRRRRLVAFPPHTCTDCSILKPYRRGPPEYLLLVNHCGRNFAGLIPVETKVQQIIVALMALVALGLAYASGALASDLGKAPPDFYEEMGKAPPPPPRPLSTKSPLLTKAPRAAPPAISWTGYYLGGDAGAAWASTPATWNPLPSSAAFGSFPITANDRRTKFVGGGHIGYNSQFAPE
jgi:hypothetical protein